jgi:hypothetical protein
VDGARGQLLARAALPAEEDRHVAVGDPVEEEEELAHDRALPHDRVVAVLRLRVRGGARIERLGVLQRGLLPLDPAAQDPVQLLGLVVGRARLLVQARVLERDGGLVGERDEERQVAPGEDAALEAVVQVERAEPARADADGHAGDRAQVERAGIAVRPDARVLVGVRAHDRLAARGHLLRDAARHLEGGLAQGLHVEVARHADAPVFPSLVEDVEKAALRAGELDHAVEHQAQQARQVALVGQATDPRDQLAQPRHLGVRDRLRHVQRPVVEALRRHLALVVARDLQEALQRPFEVGKRLGGLRVASLVQRGRSLLLETQLGRAHRDDVAGPQRPAAHAPAVEPGPVLALQVEDAESAARRSLDPAVRGARLAVADLDVGLGGPAQEDEVLVDRDPAERGGAAQQGQVRHAKSILHPVSLAPPISTSPPAWR